MDIKNTLLTQVNEILDIYENDEKRQGGYSMTEYFNNTAPEDYNEDRMSFNDLRDYADSMYYMLTDIKSAIEKLKEDISLHNYFDFIDN